MFWKQTKLSKVLSYYENSFNSFDEQEWYWKLNSRGVASESPGGAASRGISPAPHGKFALKAISSTLPIY